MTWMTPLLASMSVSITLTTWRQLIGEGDAVVIDADGEDAALDGLDLLAVAQVRSEHLRRPPRGR
jgi:hypothetical protein